MDAKTPIAAGLEDIIAGKSSICEVDEKMCELFYYGYSIVELAEKSTFEEVAYLLLYGNLPKKEELAAFSAKLIEEMKLDDKVKDVIRLIPHKTDPMDVLKIAIGIEQTIDPDASSNTNETNIQKAIRIMAKIPSIITYHHHCAQNSEDVIPNPNLSFPANFLYMLRGNEPESTETMVLDKSLILYAEHELNASTFAARVIASTLSDMHSAVIAAIAALKGPLHGGANERVMEMLLEIDTPENVEPWIMDALTKKKRIMGFGHRVYKRKDPRSPIIKKMAKELSEKSGNNKWFEMSEKIEVIINREKGLHDNLDFYSSSVYYLLGIPIPLYTPIFVISRITGWVAHIMEQYNDNRLIRPRAEYIGPDKREYVKIDNR